MGGGAGLEELQGKAITSSIVQPKSNGTISYMCTHTGKIPASTSMQVI